MMRQMRENTKWIMLITALAFVALMVFEWGMDLSGRSAGGGVLGSVNGTPVTYEQYNATLRNLYDQTQASQDEPISSQQNAEIEDRAFDEVVNQILIQQELSRRGIRVTDEEVRQAALYSPPPELRQSPVFETDGQFDPEKYRQFLASNQADERLLLQLEAYYRDVIPRSKLLNQVTSGMYISDAEIWEVYRDRNEQARVAFVAFDPADRIEDAAVTIEPSEIRDYYRDNEEEFQVPARATLRAVVLPKAPTAADTAAVAERAEEILERIRSGEEDFADVAEAESADEASADEGGDLGWFGRGDMVEPIEEAAFDASTGEVVGPVRTRFGYHVLEVTEQAGDSVRARHVLLPFERSDESEIEMLTLADSLEILSESVPIGEAARGVELEVQQVEITDAFPFLAGAGEIGEGADWAFEEAETGEVSPLFENRQAFYLLELVRSSPGGVMSLEQATPTIRDILRLRKKIERARAEAEEVVRAARGGSTFEEAAAGAGLAVREAGPFTRLDFVPGLGQANRAVGAAFGLGEGEVSQPVVTEENVFVLRLLERIPADTAAFEEQKESLREQLTPTLQEQRLEQWLEGLRENARIVDRRDEMLGDPDEEPPAGGFGFPAF